MKTIILFLILLTSIINAQEIFTKSNGMYIVNLDITRKYPKKCVKLLIDNLSVINTNCLSHVNNSNNFVISTIIDSIISLRTLTVTDFLAKTSYVFNNKNETEKTRKYFLNLYNTNNIPFYSYWMSRDSYFFAPVDVQGKIIDKWKEWYKKNANTWHYNTNKIIEDVHSPYPKIEEF